MYEGRWNLLSVLLLTCLVGGVLIHMPLSASSALVLPCPPGHIRNNVTNKCEYCPDGEFTHDRLECHPCEPTSTTLDHVICFKVWGVAYFVVGLHSYVYI
jgi:hypothetical protein